MQVNGNLYLATLNGNQWSVSIPLFPGINAINVIAYPSDPDCNSVHKNINIFYAAVICEDPITNLAITTHYN
ncbi:MAG: hypothetical protein H6765_09170 [Candidatus Peribacteria bacterium]|nr:MAG: hypothetical protein H6765_09170 [Candidatus Peribacteria bacterium]